MNRRCLQFFFAALVPFLAVAYARATTLQPGVVYQLSFTDVEGRQVALQDGRATLLTVATRMTEPKARLVGNRVPDQYVGHPHYRCVTVINFQQKIPPLLRRIISAVVRRRFRAEAKVVQTRYSARRINHSPRADLFAIADFDGGVVRLLGISPVSDEFAVFIFDGRGRLVRRWRDVPTSADLGSALASAL
jgi:hypothetical protein